MKLKKEFIVHESDGEQIMVSTGKNFNGMVRSNKTAAFIIDCLSKDTTEEEIIKKMLERYDASEDVIAKSVSSVLTKLREIGAIDD